MKKQIFTISVIASVAFASVSKAQDQKAASSDDFKPSGNVYGYVFGDYYMKSKADSAGRGAGNTQYRGIPQNFDAFQIRRAYLGYDFNISKQFSSTVLLADEAGPNANTFYPTPGTAGTNLDQGGSNTMYLKYAYLQWKGIFKGSTLKLGQYQTASFATPNGTEPLWGYRSVERTILDIHNNDASSDLGVSLEGHAWTQHNAKDSLKPSFIGYIAQIGNGASAKPETDKFKKVRGNLYVSAMQQKLVVGLYADFNQTALNPENQATTTLKVYADYKTQMFKIGAEFFQQTTKNSDNITMTGLTNGNKSTGTAVNTWSNGVQQGISVFLSGRIIKEKLNYFARIDMYNPDTKYNQNDIYSAASSYIKGSNLTYSTFYKQTFYTLGLDYTPITRVHIMPNIWVNQYTAMMSYDNGGQTINKVTTYNLSANQKKGTDFVPRITLYYIFNASKSVSNNGMYDN